jgi:arsenite/tail-anchored protein-transporting ATPase
VTLRDVPVHVFIGKGGVGKTTCAAATALFFAEGGEDSLALSTDPTPSLSNIFELTGRQRERHVAPHLFVTELGLEEVRAMWDERFGRQVYAVFSTFVDIDYPTFVEFVTSVLPGLNEEFMVDQIRRVALAGHYQRIIWDTAPLGQTLALLETPAVLANHLRMAPRVYSHLRSSGAQRESVMTVLGQWTELAAECMTFLRERVSFSMVTIPETLAVDQLDAVFAELRKYQLGVDRIIVNNVITTVDSAFLEEKARQQATQLALLRRRYGDIPLVELPLLSHEVRGTSRLREIASVLAGAREGGAPVPERRPS